MKTKEIEFVYSKYPHLKNTREGKNPIIDSELYDLCDWLKEYSDLTNAKLVEENDFLNTGICVMQEELSAAKERVKELEKINLIKNKLNDELTIMGTNYAVIINKLENETRLFYKIIVFLTVLFFIIKIINIFI
jgi:hypothetical protein